MFGIKSSWNISFISTIKLIRIMIKSLKINTNNFREITDIDVPNLLTSVNSNDEIICKKVLIENKFECIWIYNKNIKDYKNHNKYIFFIHGGAFCFSNTNTYKKFLYELSEKTSSVIFSVDYRRAPEYKYPIPLEDCIKAYKYFLNKIYNTDTNICIFGDSAGGNLTIYLISYLIQNNFTKPNVCILVSPWIDLTDKGKSSSWIENSKYDLVKHEFTNFFSYEYIDITKNNLEDVSPCFMNTEILSQFPPTLIEYGECEVLYDQIHHFYKKMKKHGVLVHHNCRKDMIHDFPLLHFTNILQINDFFNDVNKFIVKK